ncbi:phosphomannomutase [Novosphingobium kunmingense]|uniref:Phosphomannomutase n=2 Tax=Novosphingobium kunmingense TaxID=1211806 RepID=A0A2N0H6N1_9SPHN|nr:phosphomannomutase [Novosphingobium kunmingense]
MTVGELMAESGVAFGTSGARGTVVAMTDRVCHGYTAGFLRYLATLGEFAPGTQVALAGDLRPSTPRILAACAQAVRDLGGEPVYCGLVPTPTLALFAFAQGIPSLMVTGSHIPADRNGIKFYRPHGEVLKEDEAGMMTQQVAVDGRSFDPLGSLIGSAPLPTPIDVVPPYVARYRDAFGSATLAGKRIGIYQHSAVGRDVLVAIVEALGGEAVPLGRSDEFVPVDTEAVRPADIELARQWAEEQGFDAIVSTDGDSDRPLLADEAGEWLRGDVLGVLCARQLGADRVVTPVSSNTVLEETGAFAVTARTRIGSPYVIAEMNSQIAAGGKRVCGYEANGGFLLGSDLANGVGTLSALPTRDAVLPILATLVAAGPQPLSALVDALPPRVTYSNRIADFPTESSKAILARLENGTEGEQLGRIEHAFGAVAGKPVRIDRTDGLRITFGSGEVIHLRPSGNAPELRCYSEATSAERARTINDAALDVVRTILAKDVATPA